MKERMKDFYMTLADSCAGMSRAENLQVGAVVVKKDNILAFGWNGTPAGWDNTCEYDLHKVDEHGNHYVEKKTKPEVLHAERNALDKLARGHETGRGASLFTTHAPCMECAKSIYNTGIKKVYYKEEYKSPDGLTFLQYCGIVTEKLK